MSVQLKLNCKKVQSLDAYIEHHGNDKSALSSLKFCIGPIGYPPVSRTVLKIESAFYTLSVPVLIDNKSF